MRWIQLSRCLTTSNNIQQPRAAACIIGNEVLTGKINDTNTHYLAKFLFKRGVSLIRVETIPDDIQEIVSTVQRLSQLVGKDGFVFTSGGIGPTHDDITYEGVARAFHTELEVHQPTYNLMSEFMIKKNVAGGINQARKRMATLPKGCKVLTTPGLWVPLAVIENVYVLPGVPWIFEKMLQGNSSIFQGFPISRRYIQTMMKEGDIADILAKVQNDHPNLSIGSYVRCHQSEESYNVQVSVEGLDLNEVENVSQSLCEALNGTVIIPEDDPAL